ncbi:glycoside hydrolase [Nibricoccus aquaticus]|uniref:Glycoside hydrolase n=1 Tax=Nibricoccus aquaticus TaxID=2576891 RepID=A0A290Q8H1_9BACT|nr:glycoside hydrolase family 28 protein [Nibricoccus aquaticus]ATC64547.1 glycoside hydrolase [Nibricoccus aquaticus]
MKPLRPLSSLLATAFILFSASTATFAANTFDPATLPAVTAPSIPQHTVRITDFGAISDGHSLNTDAINRAIASVAAKGGGRVVIPAGLWRTGPIVLQSRIELHVEDGALVQFSDNRADYPLIETSFEGRAQLRCQPPISGRDLEHIAIIGKGVFDGAGQAWRPVKKMKMTAGQWSELVASGGALNANKDIWYPSADIRDGNEHRGERSPEFLQRTRDSLRPVLVSLTNCKHILLDGPTFQNSPGWCVHPLMCDQLIVRNVTIRNPWFAQNGDGLDLESCSNVIVENSSFDVGDDAICLKSGRDAEGRARGRPTENVIVRHCIVYHGHGGFVVGSEMSGGVRRIHVTDVTFIGTDVGLRFKSTRGRGGVVEDILIERVRMTNIPGEALLFDLFYGTKAPDEADPASVNSPLLAANPVTEETPAFRNILIRDLVSLDAERAALIRGLPEMPVENVRLENVRLSARSGIFIADAANVSFNDVQVLVEKGPALAIRDSAKIETRSVSLKNNDGALVTVKGSRSSTIDLRGTGTASTAITVASEVPTSAVTRP